MENIPLCAARSHHKRTCKYLTRQSSNVTRYMLHVTRYTLHVTRYTLHVTRYTLHVTRHSSDNQMSFAYGFRSFSTVIPLPCIDRYTSHVHTSQVISYITIHLIHGRASATSQTHRSKKPPSYKTKPPTTNPKPQTPNPKHLTPNS